MTNKLIESKYPELEKIAMEIAKETASRINELPVHEIQSAMPYKRQYILEKVIEILQAAV